MLTPVDIHNKEFKRSFRGYNEEEIDDFLGSSDAIFAAEEIWVKYTASWEERR